MQWKSKFDGLLQINNKWSNLPYAIISPLEFWKHNPICISRFYHLNFATYLVDGIKNELTETSNVVFTLLRLGPFLFFGVVEVITPELLHHLSRLNFEFGGVHLSKLLQGESPSVEARSKTNSSQGWFYLYIYNERWIGDY